MAILNIEFKIHNNHSMELPVATSKIHSNKLKS